MRVCVSRLTKIVLGINPVPSLPIYTLSCVCVCLFVVCAHAHIGGLPDAERAHGTDRAPECAQVVTNKPLDAFSGVLPHYSRGDDEVPLQEPEHVT